MPTRVMGLSIRMCGPRGVRDLLRRADPLALPGADEERPRAHPRAAPSPSEASTRWLSAWKHLDHFSNHVYRHWIVNSLVYSFIATAITLAVGIPAGYGLALGRFPGRKLILSLTLISMIIPGGRARAPDLPRDERRRSLVLFGSHVHVINSAWSVISR